MADTKAAQDFSAITGRAPTDFEWKWANDAWVQKQYGGVGGALQWQANRLKGVADTVSQMANAYGVTLDQKGINRIRDTYMPTGSSSDADIAKAEQYFVAELTKLKDQQTATEQQAKIDAVMNPSISDGNRASAAGIIKQMYGRDASQDEIDYFAKELAAGTSAYELGQFLTQTPEYQTKIAEAERQRVATEAKALQDELRTSLAQQNDIAFQKAIPNILSSYMKAGKLNSSGVDSAVAQAKAQLQQQQEQYLAGLQYENAIRQQGYGREDFLNANRLGYQNQQETNAANQRQQQALLGYSNYAQYQSPWDSMNRQYALSDARTQRANELQDYYMQQADYNSQMSAQRRAQREAALYGLGGSLGAGAINLGLGATMMKAKGV